MRLELKIKELKLDNFAQFTNFECQFGDKITRLVGVNGSGKTTVGLTAIWAGIKGIAERTGAGQLVGERFRFIGRNRATADIEIILEDVKQGLEIVIKNHITKQSNQIEFDCTKGVLPEDWINDFLNVAFLSAKNFAQLNSKEQSLLLGINTETFDNELSELKQEFTIINGVLRGFGDLVEVEKVEGVSVSDLIVEKTKADEHNSEQLSLQADIDENKDDILRVENEILALQNELKSLKSEELYKPKELINAVSIVEKINNAEEINSQVVDYNNFIEKKSAKEKKSIELEKNKSKQEEVISNRLNYIKEFKFGFEGLNVDEKGGLILNEKPIKEPYFSKGELELIVANLYASLNPVFKTRFIDDFELLDKANQKKIIDNLIKKGFQVITAEVGETPKDKQNSILLRECKKVDNYTKQESLL